MAKTWKPTTAGILSIIAGALNFIVGIVVSAVGSVLLPWAYSGMSPYWGSWGGPVDTGPIVTTVGIVLIVLGIVSVIGGIFAIQRRTWGMALAGGICALFPPPIIVLGVLSIVFVSLSKGEFDNQPGLQQDQ